VAYVDIPTSNWDCSESVFLIKPNELETKGKYLAYILSSDIAKNQYERGAAGAIMKGVRKATLESLLIPIPSLPEQQRIVEQLDTFTNSIENLKEQIAQRRKQYEYYRDQLLDLEGKEGVVMKTLGEVSNYRRGSFPQPYGNKEWYDGDGAMPFVQVADVEEFSRKLKDTTKQYISKLAMAKSVYAPKGTVIVTLQGSIGKVAITQYDSYVDRTLGIFEGYRINIDKVYFALQLEKIFSIKREKARGGTIKTITKEEFTNFPIPIPSLQEQQRIVSILDTFEASISNLESQLKQREQQYEYYRNKLLTFE
jgi:type I restriction enzyme S subunit